MRAEPPTETKAIDLFGKLHMAFTEGQKLLKNFATRLEYRTQRGVCQGQVCYPL